MPAEPGGSAGGPAEAAEDAGRPRVVAVVVTYQPDVAATAALLEALRPQVSEVVVVDDGSPAATLAPLASAVTAAHAHLLRQETNRGIAAAQNAGIRWARDHGAELVLLSDQDSLPAADMIDRLLEGLRHAQSLDGRVGAVGPVTVDERAPEATLLFAAQRWGPRRAAVPAAEGALVPVAFLLASGCLVPVEVLDAIGPMNESWFIDHVDLEWGLRARRQGLRLYGVTGAQLAHTLGDRTVRLPGREREVHIHSPVRNYYMARNTVLLVRSGLMPVAWRIGYVAWIVKYIVFYGLLQRPRRQRLRLMVRGLWHGISGRTGKL